MIRKLLIGILVLVNCILLYSFLLSDKGVFSLRSMRANREELATRVEGLKESSQSLSQEIRWLGKEGPFTERVIRDKTNFLKDDEIVYIIDDEARGRAKGDREAQGIGDQ